MNNKKICFISCVNNKQAYSECLYYLNHLEAPEGYEVEFLSIENAQSMAKGYNEAMRKSDAKFKVYLHQDIYITNKKFIEDVLNCFRTDAGIGMLGVVGARHLPSNGVWWESTENFGKVFDSHTGQMGLLEFNRVEDKYQEVQAIDGIIMITQYDLPWREDIFDGWHFYDISQSMEFIKAGYKVAVPAQLEPWCIHDCGIANIQNGYEHYRQIFIKEYSRLFLPSSITAAADAANSMEVTKKQQGEGTTPKDNPNNEFLKRSLKFILRRIENDINYDDNIYEITNEIKNKKYDYEEIIRHIEICIIDKERLLNTIALECYKEGMIKESIGMLLKSYEINTQNKDTVYNLSYITYKLGDLETALSMLNAIENKDKDITSLIDEIMEASNEQ